MTELDKQLDVHNKFMQGQRTRRTTKLKCANDHRGPPRRDGDGLAPRGRRLGRRARHRRPQDDGAGGRSSTRRSSTNFKAGGLRQVRVPPHREGGLADASSRSSTRWPTCSTSRRTGRKCGPAFDAVVAEDPTGPQAAEAAYASVLCYQNIYTEQHQGGADKKGSGNLPGRGEEGRQGQERRGQGSSPRRTSPTGRRA